MNSDNSYSDKYLEKFLAPLEFALDLKRARSEPKYLLDQALAIRSNLPISHNSSSPWQFIAGSTASGLPVPCRSFSCRSAKVVSATAFATLYADQLILYEPISVLFSGVPNEEWLSKLGHRRWSDQLLFYLRCIQIMQPAIVNGIITFKAFETENICDECFSRLLSKVWPRGNHKISAQFNNALLDNSEVSYDSSINGRHYFSVVSKMLDADHERTFYSIPFEKLTDSHCLTDKPLSRKQIHKLGIFRDRIYFGAADIISKNKIGSQIGQKKFLSDSLEVGVMERIFGRDFIRTNFDTDVPFLATTNIETILRIRENSWPQFERFRSNFFEFIERAEASTESLDDIYRRELLPEIISIEEVVRDGAKLAKADLIEGSTVAMISFSASVATSGISSALSIAAAVLGGGHFTKKMVPAARKLFSENPEIRKSSFYFPWKVKKSLRK